MAIKDYFKNVAKAVFNTVDKSAYNIAPNAYLGFSLFKESIFSWGNANYSAYYNKAFYAGVNLIVRKITEVPLTYNTKRVTATKGLYKFYNKQINNLERERIKAEVLQLLPSHDLINIIDEKTIEDFWYRYHFGNGFLWFEKLGEEFSRNSKPFRAHSLDQNRITIVYNNNRFDRVDHYLYSCYNGEQIRLEPSDVFHFKNWNPLLERVKSLGVDEVCAMDIALQQAGDIAQGANYKNSGRGTLFSSKSDVDSEGNVVDKMTAAQMAQLKETIDKDMAGVHNTGRMKFTNGEVVVTPYGDTISDMEVLEADDHRWKNIFAILGIPKELTPVNLTSSENSVNAGYKALVTNLIIPIVKKFDNQLTDFIQKWWPGVVVVTDVSEFNELAADLEKLAKTIGQPSLTEDEKRRAFGYDEMGGELGSAILVDSNKMNLKDVVAGLDEEPINANEL